MSYRVVVIGAGGISRTHGECLSALPEVALCGWADVRLERAQERAQQFGGVAFDDYTRMLTELQPDVAHICLPHFLHAPVAMACMKHGVHVLTEKPMSIHLQDAQAMVDTAKETEKTLGVIFQNRYNAGSQMVKQALEAGKLGAVRSARAQVCWFRDEDYYLSTDWRGRWETEGGGVLINQSIHTLDLIRWLVGTPVRVQAEYANFTHPRIEVEDMFTAYIDFANDARANMYLTTNHTANDPVEVHLYCDKGQVDMVGADAVIHYADGTEEQAKNQPVVATSGPAYWGDSHMNQIQRFYHALDAGETPEIDGAEGLATQRLLCALYEAGRKRETVEV